MESSSQQRLPGLHGYLVLQLEAVPFPAGKEHSCLWDSKAQSRDIRGAAWSPAGPRSICDCLWRWENCGHQVP